MDKSGRGSDPVIASPLSLIPGPEASPGPGSPPGGDGGVLADGEAAAVDGYHVISVDADAVAKAEDGTPIRVELVGRKGTLLLAPLSVLSGYE